ncbi:MAG: MFS transporter [Acutalibacteraceae bacterium]|jgi:MFS family permease
MAKNSYGQIKYACYMVNISMSVVSTLSPLLFLTFRSLYRISFSMLGALVLINFCTQLAVDLIFSFYSHKFNIAAMVKLTPALTALGLFVYAVFPLLFPGAVYAGLVAGTVIFAASGGLAEVLISPVIAALPSEHPEREMSKLHSIYAWGVVAVVIVNTLLLSAFGKERWQWIALAWMAVPCLSCILFFKSKVPTLATPEKASNVFLLLRQKDFIICFLCIFLGGASECTMSQWSSSYLEQALGIPKVWGDVCGVAVFAATLGLGRTLYSKYGKNIYKVLAVSAAGATVCYLAAAVSTVPLVGLVSCAMTGLCTAMLWPGSLIMASDKFPAAGVAVFALMAAGGDLGGAIGPQVVGTVVDFAMTNESVQNLSAALQLTTEQLSMKIGLTSAIVFPLLATVLYVKNYRKETRKDV